MKETQQIIAAIDLPIFATKLGLKVNKDNMACCPFHGEKTPSFKLNKDYYYCFGCQETGNVFDLVMHINGCDFKEALNYLAQHLGIELTRNITKKHESNADPKSAAKHYLKEVRGLDVPSDWYAQETFARNGNHSATVRFVLENGSHWERIIDASLFKQKANFSSKPTYKHSYWGIPEQKITKGDTVYITEGIFDAIALWQFLGKRAKVVSILTTSNDLQGLLDKYSGKNITWSICADVGFAGEKAAKKWTNELSTTSEQYEVRTPLSDLDWNDAYKQGVLTQEYFEKCYWQGMRTLAKSAAQKYAWSYVQNVVDQGARFPSYINVFDNCYYSCEVDHEALDGQEVGIGERIAQKEDTTTVVSFLTNFVRTKRLSTATAQFLYSEYDPVDERQAYIVNLYIKGKQKPIITRFKSSDIVDANAFHAALLNTKMGQVVFDGTKKDLGYIVNNMWFNTRKPTVQSVRRIGYNADHEAYIYSNFAYKNGRKIHSNDHEYLNIGDGVSVRTSFRDWFPVEQLSEEVAWFDDFYLMGGNNALTGLAFWLLSLFVQQIRKEQPDIAFWEFTGQAQTGKSTIIRFLWKLLGRAGGYEGDDPEKMNPKALSRLLMQAANFPVVLLEGDRVDVKPHHAKFSIDSLKTLSSGFSPLGRANRDNGIGIDNPPFYGTIAISQNAQIDGEEQVLSRIVQCIATKEHFNDATTAAANRIKALRPEQVGHWLHKALKKEHEILNLYFQAYSGYVTKLMTKEEIVSNRICENHAQIMAMGKCLQLIIPELNKDILDNWLKFMSDRAIQRQTDIAADHPLVVEFWQLYEDYNKADEYQDANINFMKDHEPQIAINLNYFWEILAQHEHRKDNEFKTRVTKLLKGSTRYQFVSNKNVTRGNTTKRCWVFKKPTE